MPKLQEHYLEVSERNNIGSSNCLCVHFFPPHTAVFFPGLDQFGDTILFTTDDVILEAMSRYDETFLSESDAGDSQVYEEELQRPRTADGEGEERPFTQAGFREEDIAVSTESKTFDLWLSPGWNRN